MTFVPTYLTYLPIYVPEYVVLSHVRTLSGLYLVKLIDINKSFQPSDELKRYIKHAKEKETTLLTTRKDAISKIKWM